jgi:hypothetical protein
MLSYEVVKLVSDVTHAMGVKVGGDLLVAIQQNLDEVAARARQDALLSEQPD